MRKWEYVLERYWLRCFANWHFPINCRIIDFDAIKRLRGGTKKLPFLWELHLALNLFLKTFTKKKRPEGRKSLLIPFPPETSSAFSGGTSFIQRRYGWSYWNSA